MKKRVKSLLRLVWAEHSFKDSKAGLKHLIDENLSPGEGLFSCIAAGVVCSYSRPFLESNGLGTLKGTLFDSFEGTENPLVYSEMHEYVLKTRNRLYGHMDLCFSSELFEGDKLGSDPCRINVTRDIYGIQIEVNSPNIDPLKFKDLFKLINLQAERARVMIKNDHKYLFECNINTVTTYHAR